jgi:hypothetical protein
MKPKLLGALCCLALWALGILPTLHAQQPYDADQVLAENRFASVTRGDYEAELVRLRRLRSGFANNSSGSRLISRLLLTRRLPPKRGGIGQGPGSSVSAFVGS